MNILLLGGTAWLGREIAATARAGGHQVCCVARGTAVPAGVEMVQANRDRDDALAPVADRRWDAVVDVARQPGQVRRAVRDLEPVTDHYVFISTVSVYASQAQRAADESTPLLQPLTADVMDTAADYGAAKVACEHAVTTSFGPERATIIRAGLLGGPHDPSGRTSYWVRRCAYPADPAGRVLVPAAPGLLTAVLDVRDLAAWVVALAAGPGLGVVNALGAAVTFAEYLQTARTVAGHSGPLVVADDDWLIEHGVQQWAGERSLPLWLHDSELIGMNVRSTAAARAAGLVRRPLVATLTDTLAAEPAAPDPALGAGLSAAAEQELLAALDLATPERP